MEDNEDPFDQVLVDAEDYSKEVLAGTVAEYVKIDQNKGRLIPEDEFHQLSSKGKILVSLLAQKIRFELEMVENEWIGPTKIADISGLKKGTVYPAVRDLADSGLIENEDGKYRVRVVKINEVKNNLEG